VLGRFLLFGADVGDDAHTLATERGVLGAAGAFGVDEEAGVFSVGVHAGVDQGREEGEVVHAHRNLAADEGIVDLGEEGVAQAGRLTAVVQLAVELHGLNRFWRIDDAHHVVVLVLPVRAPAEHHVFHAHSQRVVVSLGVDAHTVEAFVGTGEEVGDVHQLHVVLGRSQRIAILFFKSRHLLGVFEQVAAIGPAVGVAFGGVGVVAAGAGGIFAVVGQRGFRHRLGNAFIDHEVGHFQVVALGCALAQPLA